MSKNLIDEKQWNRIVAQAWADEDYKARLMAEPAAVLAEEGVDLPQGLEVKIVQAEPNQVWLVLPPKPEADAAETGEERIAPLAF